MISIPTHSHTHMISSMAGHCWKPRESNFEASSVIPQSLNLKQRREGKKIERVQCAGIKAGGNLAPAPSAATLQSRALPKKFSPRYSLNLPEVLKTRQPLGQGTDTSFPKVVFR